MDEILVFTDGGCQGNPGPGGWAFVLLDGGRELSFSGGEKFTTNNKMELTAAIEALKMISQNDDWKGRKVNVFSDSQYVKNGITSWIKKWKANGWKTAAKKDVLNKELWVQLDAYFLSLNVEWNWVKGHAGIKYNEMCDQLCAKEMTKFTGKI